MIYASVGGIKDLLKQDLALEFCRKQNKYISILTETHVTHDQIRQIKNNWLGPIFLSRGNSHTKGLLSQFHPGLEGVTEVDTDPKGRFSGFLRLHGITPESSWLEGVPLIDCKIIWKKNVREMKTKLYLKTLKLKWIKLTEMVETKHKDFIDVVPKVQGIQSLH